MKTEKNYYNLLISITNDESFSKHLSRDLIESDEKPVEFFNQHKEKHFSNRGITKAGDNQQTLCYVLDKLEQKEFLCELDWKPDSEEFNSAINLLSKGKIEGDLFSEKDEEGSDGMFELIFDAEDYLKEYGLAIVEFPLDGDSHPIAIVSFEKGEEIQTMINELFE